MSNLEALSRKLNLPSPLQKLRLSHHQNVNVYIKRDDLIHPLISGNKWRKLKYNLVQYVNDDCDGIITVGGPFSNHLVALAAACKELNISCKAFIRGIEIDSENDTLRLCRLLGMQLANIHPDHYSLRNEDDFISSLDYSYTAPYYIAEGGSNEYSIRGVQEIISEWNVQPDYVVLPIGTGATMYGLAQDCDFQVIGISPFKKGKVVIPFLDKVDESHIVNYDFALKGYGRFDKRIVEFINRFWAEHEIPLDPIYNVKGMMALQHYIDTDFFEEGSTVVYLHTGGLQGIAGFNKIYGKKGLIKVPQNLYSPDTPL